MSIQSREFSDWSSEDYDDGDGFSVAEKKQRRKKIPERPLSKSCEKIQRRSSFTPRQSKQDLHLNALTACMAGNIGIIDDFLASGHNINAFLNTGWTLLLYGSSSVLPIVVDHLLKRGADANVHKDGYTPLMAVCDSSVGNTEQYLKCISILLEAKADPNATQKDGITALMYAAKIGNEEVVKKMLECSQDIDAVDTDGRSAIFYAVTSNHPEIVKILIANEASTSIKDRRDLTIKDIAMTKEYNEILEMLKFGEEERIESFYPVSQVTNWKDVFPETKQPNDDMVNVDVAAVLYALGLDKYRPMFKGMELNKFLKLTEEELIELGMGMPFHRKQFLNGLMKFHTKKWSTQSLGVMNNTIVCRLYDGITLLGNIVRQMGVIGSSFGFVKNGLLKIGNNKNPLSDADKYGFKTELQQAEQSLGLLKKDLQQMLTFAQKVKSKTVILPAADYIGPEKTKDNKQMKWPIVVGATVITGFYLTKTANLHRLWN